jgi:hypothetical protein
MIEKGVKHMLLDPIVELADFTDKETVDAANREALIRTARFLTDLSILEMKLHLSEEIKQNQEQVELLIYNYYSELYLKEDIEKAIIDAKDCIKESGIVSYGLDYAREIEIQLLCEE